ncbi:MAG TPA: helix-turn-helix domain-containing protein [Anaeromyxobacteraceae bacterium]|nr:helix-turn-helix domain-containing protein [Anaeromyxobacteraceae bacterium]
MGSVLLTSAEVARILGVTPGSVKRWADQGVLPRAPAAGPKQRFDRSEVDRLQRRRDAAGGSGDQFVDALLGEPDAVALQAALLAERARQGAWWRLAESLARALCEIGARWESGILSILEEHVASERLARALARVAESLPPRPGAPRLLLVTAEGDDHTLGLSLAEVCAREYGWQVLWAGRVTPLAEVVAVVAAGGAEAVAVSASPVCTPGDLLAQAERLGAICRAGEVALALCGRGPWPEWLPYGDRLCDFASLRDWMDAIERARAFTR